MGRKVINAVGGDVRGKKIAVLGLTFKPNTDDMRDAPSIPLVEGLVEGGAEVVAFDPVGREQAEKVLPAIVYAASAEAVADDADALVVVTEWDEFRALDLDQLAGRMRGKVLVDLRNIYDRADAEKAGLTYRGIGRGRAPFPAA
jgi:UDPglucose 6-dehydrogenase